MNYSNSSFSSLIRCSKGSFSVGCIGVAFAAGFDVDFGSSLASGFSLGS